MAITILDEYYKKAPSYQSTVDLFINEWSSKLPDVDNIPITTGHANLFNDARITVMNEKFPLHSKKVLELGPLEGAHTYMIAKYGAKEIVAVESNSRAFLKCLIVKELYNLNTANFLLGDAIEYMSTCNKHFDICLASGILYHSQTPGKFIESISKVSDRVLLWTHFYDDASIKEKPDVLKKFKSIKQESIKGFTFDLHKYEYGEALDWKGFCGGSESFTSWITKDTLLKLLTLCGFAKVTIIFEDFNHQNGPNICLLAEKFN
jgi:hypothetical protein